MFKWSFILKAIEEVWQLSKKSYYATLDDPHAVLSQWPFLRVIQGHMRSNALLPLTLDRLQIAHWGWSQCVSLAKTHQLICNMGYFLSRHVTSLDPDITSNFDLSIFRSTCMVRRVSTRGTWWRSFSVSLFVQKIFKKWKKWYIDLSSPQPLISSR